MDINLNIIRKFYKYLHIFIFLVLLFFNQYEFSQVKGKSVITTLESQWLDTSLIYEAGEFFNEENEAFFWNYLEKINNHFMTNESVNFETITTTSEKLEYDILLSLAKVVYDKDDYVTWAKYLKFSLSLRIYSPKIEMFNQIHKENLKEIHKHHLNFDCKNEFHIMYNNSAYCDINDFVKNVKFTNDMLPHNAIQPHIYPSVDHRYRTYVNESRPLPIVILYSDARTLHFTDAHKMLSFLANQHHINYYYRPITAHRGVSPKLTRKTFLSGYGVELAIKSTEYKAKDDHKIKDNEEGAGMEDDVGRHTQDEDGDIVQGLNFTRLRQLHPELKNDLFSFKEHLVQNDSELRTFKAWELNDISFRAAQLISKANTLEEKLKVMRDISQNFPTKAPSLLSTDCGAELRKEIVRNQHDTFQMQMNLAEGDSLFFVNRQPVDLEHFNVFDLFQTLRKEIKLMKILHSYGIESSDAYDILSTRLELKEEEIALDFTSPAIKYVNDLETDDDYRGWSPSLSVMEQTFWFGMVTEIRKNLFNVILIIDPFSPNNGSGGSLAYLKAFRKFHKDKQPFHMGIVLDVPTSVPVEEGANAPTEEPVVLDEDQKCGSLLYGAFNYAYLNEKKRIEALDTIIEVMELLSAEGYDQGSHHFDSFSKSLCSVMSTRTGLSRADCLALGNNPKYTDGIYDGKEFYQTSGLGPLPQILFNGVPLTTQQMDPSLLEKELNNMVMKNYYTFYEAYFNRKVNDKTDMVSYLNTRSNVLPRINRDILSLSGPYLDFRELVVAAAADVDEMGGVGKGGPFDPDEVDSVPYLAHLVSQKLTYLYKKTDSAIKPVSIWLVTDVDTRDGKLMVQNALKFLKSSMDTRVAIIHNPSSSPTRSGKGAKGEVGWLVKASTQAALDSQPMNVIKLFLNKLLKDTRPLTSLDQVISECAVSGMDVDGFRARAAAYLDSAAAPSWDGRSKDFIKLFELHTKFARRSLLAAPGESLIVANGKVIRLRSQPSPIFSPSDYGLTEKFMYNSVCKNLATKLGEVTDDLGEYKINDLVMKLSGSMLWAKNDARRIDLKVKEEKLGCFSSTKEPPQSLTSSSPAFELMVVLDPVSREAQLLSQVLLVLNEVIDANVKICFNCKSQISEMPLKNYYRYVLKPELHYPTAESDRKAYPVPSSARFGNPPANSLFTLNMYTPQNWLIQSIKTPYDLDNIHLSEVSSDIYATFELEYLLLEGHCYDKTSDKPPRGLQFTLGPASEPLMTDTLVMANLGYFQMKSHPGAFVLQLRSGKSADIYRVVSHQNTDSATTDSQDIIVVLDSFLSKTIHVKVSKKGDKLDEDLLVESGEEGGKPAVDPFSEQGEEEEDLDEEDDDSPQSQGNEVKKGRVVREKNQSGQEATKLATINIFSVASGHLYERFLKLMMLSVLKHTKNPVKFWFLKNYLSPTFKEFIPHMAKEYKFDYELVQYKWPRWLHQQTEKQRLIWGYKILFLDVLFPLHVDKIIYVDADQIVRTDLKELVELDLGGAPYGYTPFCDSRKDMDGFRFWKSGYWASHLGHRKYHISALYVVDLKKFRQIAAGDRLRGQYQGLSQDPNSLSNLDQDLPNNMIHQVMIKSLPQEWLWCETWCSNESKSKAKTIDLCNNPMTKEPKLHSAMRIIPEWKDYDNEIKNFTERIKARSSAPHPSPQDEPDKENGEKVTGHDGSEL